MVKDLDIEKLYRQELNYIDYKIDDWEEETLNFTTPEQGQEIPSFEIYIFNFLTREFEFERTPFIED